MPGICLYFQVHQPIRLRRFTVFDINREHTYEDTATNRQIIDKVSDKCYLPANGLMLELIERHQGAFRIAYCLSGVLMDQLERYRPEVLDSFKRLAATGSVEFLDETYYHSLAFLFSPREIQEQVALHRQKIQSLFGQKPTTFRNTELIYNDEIAKTVEKMGYRTILAEGADKILGWRSPNVVYRPAGCNNLKLLLRNYRLSDDLAFRFGNAKWPEYPLTADKYAHWIHQNLTADVINLFMDYETFGEHQWQETGIFSFLRRLPEEILKNPDFHFQTPAEVARDFNPATSLSVPDYLSWADAERDLTAWLGNGMQKDGFRSLQELEKAVRRCGDASLIHQWRLFQTSDHFYYMCTKWFADGAVHKYFNPYSSPYDAYINYMNILDDFSGFLKETVRGKQRSATSRHHDKEGQNP
jgi:alpha-amylase